MPEATNGQAMREAYESKGLTRDEFARRVRLTPRSITNIANGGPCSRSAAARIAHELGWSNTGHLFEGSDSSRTEPPPDDPAEAASPEAETEARVRGVA